LFTDAGDQTPVIPLIEVVGNIGAVDPLQIGVITLKPGVVIGLTVTVKEVVVAH
jgi:hypothetical protein